MKLATWLKRTTTLAISESGEFCQAAWAVSEPPERGLAILQRFDANCLYAARNTLQNAI